MLSIINNRYVQIALALVIGICAGAILYPSKSIKEELSQKYEKQIEILKKEHTTEVSNLQSKYDSQEKQYKQQVSELSKKVDILRTENSQLKQTQKESIVRIIKPDGTIEERTYRESQTEVISSVTTQIREEFNQKIASIEERYKKVHQERVETIKKDYESKLSQKESEISELKKSKTVEINKRSFGLAFGYLSNKDYFSNISYDIAGPFFLDLQVQSNGSNSNAAGIGFGIRF